eukprot:TRINITY_DN12621_c0_g1_i1.p1 TRINITY_DN12621_c0_g1~~TRINITY_DN12621_c0_g1_i1.p1  ORF type:complete len:214 (-),score=66.78 TRINITY_DN12621_c0_g1_i1:420-1061(-)
MCIRDSTTTTTTTTSHPNLITVHSHTEPTSLVAAVLPFSPPAEQETGGWCSPVQDSPLATHSTDDAEANDPSQAAESPPSPDELPPASEFEIKNPLSSSSFGHTAGNKSGGLSSLSGMPSLGKPSGLSSLSGMPSLGGMAPLSDPFAAKKLGNPFEKKHEEPNHKSPASPSTPGMGESSVQSVVSEEELLVDGGSPLSFGDGSPLTSYDDDRF